MIRAINWPREALYLALIAMDACWISVPLGVAGMLITNDRSPGIGPITLFLIGAIAFYAARWLAARKWRPIDVQIATVVVALLVTLIAIRIDLFRSYALFDFGWLGVMVDRFWNLTFSTELAALIMSIVMWYRVSNLRANMLTNEIIIGRFQFGMAIVIVALLFGIASSHLPPAITTLLIAYFFFGLLAIGMSRMNVHERRVDQRSWFGITVAAAVIILVVAALATTLFSRDVLEVFSGPFNLLANIVGTILYYILMAIAIIVEVLIDVIRFLLSFLPRQPQQQEQQGTGQQPPFKTIDDAQQDPTFALITRIIAVALVAGVLIWLLIRSLRRDSKEEEDGVEETHESVFNAGLLADAAANALRNLRDRLFGVRPVSDTFDSSPAQRIRRAYRDLLQYASSRYETPRPPARTPVEHLPVLQERIPGEREELGALTQLYINARYAETELSDADAAQAEEVIRQLKQTPEQTNPQG